MKKYRIIFRRFIPILFEMTKYIYDIAVFILTFFYFLSVDFKNLTFANYVSFILLIGWIIFLIFRIKNDKK